MEPKFNLPARTTPTPDDNTSDEPKWCICQNFTQVNKITKVAPMPQGDIRAKQQCLSEHWWVAGFDFATGFYAVVIGDLVPNKQLTMDYDTMDSDYK